MHLAAADDTLLDQPLRGRLHCRQHLLLLLLGQALVQVAAPLILRLAELTVLSNDLLALFSTPNLIIELFLLITLVLDELDDHGFTLLELQLLHKLLLLVDKAASALFTLLSGRLSQCLLRALLQTRGLKGERARLRCQRSTMHSILIQSGSHRALTQLRHRGAFASQSGFDRHLSLPFLNTGINAVRF